MRSSRTTGSERCRYRPAARSSSRPTTTRSTGGTSPSAKSPRTKPTRSWPSTASQGFQPIFNGQNLADWAGPIEHYEVKDGVLRCKPNEGGTIYYNQELTDFMARVEFKLPPGGNNGLAIRYPGHGDTAYDGMCELQILDDGSPQVRQVPRPPPGPRLGLRHGRRRRKATCRPVGQWNFEEVTVKGSTDQGRAQRHA